MCFQPFTAAEGSSGQLRWAWRTCPEGGVPAGGDRLYVRERGNVITFILADIAGDGPGGAAQVHQLDLQATTLEETAGAPDQVLAHLHSRWCPYWAEFDIRAQHDTTVNAPHLEVLVLRFDLGARTVEGAAGGNSFVWARAAAEWSRWQVPSGGHVGMPHDGLFDSESTPLPAGGMLFAATDGAADEFDPDAVQFGVARVVQALNGLGTADPAATVAGLFAAVSVFTHQEHPGSDVSAICFGW